MGVKAGGNWTSLMSNTPLGQLIGFEHRFSFHAGVLIDIKLSDRLILQPNLLYTIKGSYLALSDENLNISYLETPLNVLYKFNHLHIGGGPYLGYALGGGTQSVDLSFTSATNDAVRLDYGINFSANYVFETGFFVSANYAWGLANVTNNTNQPITNTNLTLSLGRMFGKR